MAILGVVLVHSAMETIPPNQRFGLVWDVCFFGQRGVQLFFVVSAFTLFLSIDNRKQESSPTRNFFIRRFFRIAPLFYVSTCLSLFFFRSFAGPPFDVALSVLFLNGFYWRTIVHGAVGGWSIANEAIFYMLVPLLYRWLRSLRASLYALMIAMPVCFVLTRLGEHFSPSPEAKEFFTFLSFIAQFPVFLLGIAAFLLWREFSLFQEGDTRRRRLLSAFVLLSLALAFHAELPSINHKLWGGSALCATLLLALSLYSWRFLVNRITIYLGKISYSIYLLHFYFVGQTPHWIVQMGGASLLRFPVLGTLLAFLLTLAVTWPVATLSWFWIEQPGIRLGRRVIALFENRTKGLNALVPSIETLVKVSDTPDAQF